MTYDDTSERERGKVAAEKALSGSQPSVDYMKGLRDIAIKEMPRNPAYFGAYRDVVNQRIEERETKA